MDNGYEQEPVGHGRVRFTVFPARVRSGRLAFALAYLAGFTLGFAFLGAVPFSSGPAGAVVRMAFAIVCGAWAGASARRRSMERLERRRGAGGSFYASPSGLELAHGEPGRLPSSPLTVHNPLLAPGHVAGARGAAAYSWALCMLTPEGLVSLAGGMSESVARGLLADVRRVVGAGGRVIHRSTAS